MVRGLVEVFHEVRVEADFGSEKLRIEHCVLVARGAVEPGEITVGKWCDVIHTSCSFGRLQGFGDRRSWRRFFGRRRGRSRSAILRVWQGYRRSSGWRVESGSWSLERSGLCLRPEEGSL